MVGAGPIQPCASNKSFSRMITMIVLSVITILLGGASLALFKKIMDTKAHIGDVRSALQSAEATLRDVEDQAKRGHSRNQSDVPLKASDALEECKMEEEAAAPKTSKVEVGF